MAPTDSFMADQLAQDAFDADLNKTVFLVALAFAIIIQTCVTAYLAWLAFRRCTSRSRSTEGQEETERGEESVKAAPQKCEESASSHAPAPSRHHRQPSLVIKTPTSQTSQTHPADSSWTCPPQQIDLERASPEDESPSHADNTECERDIPRIVIQDDDDDDTLPDSPSCTPQEPNPHYLSVPPTTCFAPRHLVESPTLPSLSHNPLLNGRPARKLAPKKKRVNKPRVNNGPGNENANANAKKGLCQTIGAALFDISNVARLRPALPLYK